MKDCTRSCLALLALGAGLTTHLVAADWPRLGGPDGSFVSPEAGLARAWPTNGPRVLWQTELGKGFAGPAIRGGKVYLLDRTNDQQDVLRCLSLETGQELWRIAQDAIGTLPYNGSRNVPTVDEKFIFAIGPFGNFYCVDPASQQLVWSKHLVNDFKDPAIDRPETPPNRTEWLTRTRLPMWGMTQAPLLYRDMVIVAPQTQKVGLVAYEKSTGKLRWQSGYIGRNWYSHVSPTLTRLGGVDQVVMLAQPSDPEKSPSDAPPAIISSIDPNTGKILWTTQTPGPDKIPIPQPLQVADDRLFITAGYGLGAVMLHVVQTNGGWKTTVLSHDKTVGAHIHSPALYRGNIYVSSFKEQGAKSTGLVCLNKEGQMLWQTGPALQFFDGALLYADGMAFAMNGKSGELNLIDLSADGYKVLASAKLLSGSNIWAPMALSEGRLVIRDQQQMKCLDVRAP